MDSDVIERRKKKEGRIWSWHGYLGAGGYLIRRPDLTPPPRSGVLSLVHCASCPLRPSAPFRVLAFAQVKNTGGEGGGGVDLRTNSGATTASGRFLENTDGALWLVSLASCDVGSGPLAPTTREGEREAEEGRRTRLMATIFLGRVSSASAAVAITPRPPL